jgi:hypothetical protein
VEFAREVEFKPADEGRRDEEEALARRPPSVFT